MDVTTYLELKQKIIEAGFEEDIIWAENIQECASAHDFAREHCFVVANSGMKAQIAVKIFRRCWSALTENQPIDDTIFRNKPKRKAMQFVYNNRERLFDEFRLASDKITYLKTLPYIGEIIVYHLAKNFGVECCKPDRHLIRIAGGKNKTPEEICRSLANITGDKIATVDSVIWRAANLGLI